MAKIDMDCRFKLELSSEEAMAFRNLIGGLSKNQAITAVSSEEFDLLFAVYSEIDDIFDSLS